MLGNIVGFEVGDDDKDGDTEGEKLGLVVSVGDNDCDGGELGIADVEGDELGPNVGEKVGNDDGDSLGDAGLRRTKIQC